MLLRTDGIACVEEVSFFCAEKANKDVCRGDGFISPDLKWVLNTGTFYESHYRFMGAVTTREHSSIAHIFFFIIFLHPPYFCKF